MTEDSTRESEVPPYIQSVGASRDFDSIQMSTSEHGTHPMSWYVARGLVIVSENCGWLAIDIHPTLRRGRVSIWHT